MKLWEIIRYETSTQLRRYSTIFFAAGVIAMTFSAASSFYDDAQRDGVLLTAPMVITGCTVITTMLSMLVTAALAGDAATRNAQARLEPLLFTAPLRRSTYLGGHFLGAFAAAAILFALIPLTLVLGVRAPGIDRSFVGALQPLAYLKAFAVVALPNAFVTTALFFALAVLSRRAVAGYIGAALLFFGTIVNDEVIADHFGRWDLARLLDPFAFIWLKAIWRGVAPMQRNALQLDLNGGLLINRALWLGVAFVALALVHARFRMEHHAPSYGWLARRRARVAVETQPIAFARSRTRRTFTRATRVRQAIAIALDAYRDTIVSRFALLLPALGFFLFTITPELIRAGLDTPGRAMTGRVAMLYANYPLVTMATAAMIAFFAGQLLWRERDARSHDIADVAPVPDAVAFAGKFGALALLIVTLQLVVLGAGLAVQAAGSIEPEPLLWLRILFGVKLLDALLFAAVAMAVHAVVNHKHIGTALSLVLWLLAAYGGDLGIHNHLLLFGSTPHLTYSQMTGLGTSAAPWFWFELYWTGWALLCAVVARSFFVRGQESGFARRMALARQRLTRGTIAFAALALAIIIGAVTFIAYNANLNPPQDLKALAATYEKRYGRYAPLPQPLIAATKLEVELHPSEHRAEVRGAYRLVNRSGRAIDAIHLLTHRTWPTAVQFDRAVRASAVDGETGYRIYTLAKPLAPGDALTLRFDVRYVPRGFSNDGASDVVTENGSRLEYSSDAPPAERNWMPVVGYRRGAELDNAGDRRAFGLPPRASVRSLDDVAARYEEAGREHVSLETIVGTDDGETAVAPGALLRTWSANGRRYFHYKTDAPIRNGFPILSARYAVHRERWNGIDIEVLHDPAHAWNAQRIARAAKAALATYSRDLGPYPQRQLRLVEYAGGGVRLTSHPGTIVWSEGFAYAQPEADRRQIDFVSAVVAHEVAHQWWGNQLVPARVEGAALVSESLAWYSAMQVVEETYGREHLDRLLEAMRAMELRPHATAEVPLLRASDFLAVYRTGPFAMFALRETIGTKAMNAALRALFEEHRAGKPPLATSRDLYRHLQAVTPASSQALLKDLFEEITAWDLKTKDVRVARSRNRYRVTLDVDAEKLKARSGGREVRVPMNDAVEIAVYDEHDAPLYRAKHRLHAGVQTIVVEVAKEPRRAGVDPRFVLLDRNRADNVREISR